MPGWSSGLSEIYYYCEFIRWNWMDSCVWYFRFWHKESWFKLRLPLTLSEIWDAYINWRFKSRDTFLYAWWYQYLTKQFISLSAGLLYICYTYSDTEVSLCLKALVTHLTLGHVVRARVILMQKIINSWKLFFWKVILF